MSTEMSLLTPNITFRKYHLASVAVVVLYLVNNESTQTRQDLIWAKITLLLIAKTVFDKIRYAVD